jgi:hypothetical protein
MSAKSQTTGSSLITTDHEVIRRWAEERGGRPAVVRGTEDRDGHDAGLLRIKFREDNDSLEEIDWDTFFKTFDEHGLAFLYQEKISDGSPSRFHKFVRRDDN